jgi:AAA15 family ATPase/GTPase
MKLVKSFDIGEFRGIRGLKKPIELGKFNVLVGRNSSDKTSILQALYLLAMPIRGYAIPPYGKSATEYIESLTGAKNRLIYGYSGEARISFELEVKGVFRNPHSSLSSIFPPTLEAVNVEKVEVEMSTEEAYVEVKVTVSSDGGKTEVYLSWDKYETLINSLNPKAILALYIPNNSDAYTSLQKSILKDFDDIAKKGLHTKVFREYLKDLVYDKFTEIFIRGEELFARKEIEGTATYISLNDIGEGLKRFILTYFAVEHLNPALILWDDIEIAMHPSLMNTSLKWLTDSDRQVVIATHSFDVLHSLTLIEPKDAKVILLKKDDNDVIHHKSLEIDELEEILEKGIDPRAVIESLVE